jgi:mono/diheme cytochrome c family protein
VNLIRMSNVNRPLRRGARAIAVGLFLAAMAGCQDSAPAADAPAAARTTSPPGSMRVDIDAIFPEGEGRSLVLNNCQTCHTWVPIVVLQMNEAEWYRSSLEHRGRVQGLNDQEFETLYDYLKASFTPDTPVPELPPALLESWTTY